MYSKGTALLTFLGLAIFLAGPPLFGQGTGNLSGTVQDRSGAVVPGATVTVTSQDTAASRDTKTDDTGYYLVARLPIGTYTIRVNAQGFQPVEQRDIRLQVDESRVEDFTIAPSTVQQAIEVSASAITVEISNPSLGQVITSQQVAQLPLNGRDFVQLATLTPGTSKETNPNSFFNAGASSEVSIRGSFSLSVGGSRANSTDWLYDGVDNNELTAGGIAILPNIDALQEFKVLTYNYSAEYGTRGGPTVLITTKSGTNDFHGSLFEFLRNTALDARTFFSYPNREQFNENEYGGSLGGPVKRDRTFFFVDYQGRALRQGIPTVGQVPTQAMRQGDFTEPIAGVPQLYNPYSTQTVGGTVTRQPFMCDAGGSPLPTSSQGLQATGTPCNKIPQTLINPIAQQMINFYPSPNNLAAGIGSDYVAAPVKELDESEFDIRLDHNFSSQDSIFARFSYDQAAAFQPSGLPGFVAQPGGFASTQSLTDHGRNAALSETHIFSPQSINEISLGYDRIFNHILSYGSGSCESEKLGIPGANLGGISCGLVDTTFNGGFWSLGERGFAPFQGGTNIYFIKDSFDAIRGDHDIKSGGEFRANQMNVVTEAYQDGQWLFGSGYTAAIVNGAPASGGGYPMADFLLGLPDSGQHNQTFQGSTTGRRWKLYRPFIQDDWRVTPNLTLNLGLAYALVTPITETHDRQSNFSFQTGQFLIPGKGSDSRVGVQLDKTALEPRIGIAWSPRGDRKTSIRAGYGIFHDSSWNQGAQGLWENPPFFGASSFFADDINIASTRTISQGFPILTEPTSPSQFVGLALFAQNFNFRQGRIHQFNLNVQRELPGDVLLTVGYAGSRSTHLLTSGSNLNVFTPSAWSGPSYTSPYLSFTTGYGTITGLIDNGNSRYDSLQIKAETKSSKHGLYALLGYTYSNNFDNGLTDGLGTTTGVTYYPLPGASKADKGYSQIQLTHNFTGSVVYDLPFGKGKHWGNDWSRAANALLGNWEVNGIEHVTSGFPLFMQTSLNFAVDPTLTPSFSNRPDRICNGQLGHRTVNEFFNISCFVDPLTGALGNSNRAPLFGPNFVNTDFSAIKNFALPFREGMSLQFRAEFFNLWNHPQFFQPGTFVDAGPPPSGNFGAITGTVNDARLIQFALKITF